VLVAAVGIHDPDLCYPVGRRELVKYDLVAVRRPGRKVGRVFWAKVGELFDIASIRVHGEYFAILDEGDLAVRARKSSGCRDDSKERQGAQDKNSKRRDVEVLHKPSANPVISDLLSIHAER